jgi:hypothetical protein
VVSAEIILLFIQECHSKRVVLRGCERMGF